MNALTHNHHDHLAAGDVSLLSATVLPPFGVSRAILLCLGYGLFSLFATWFPVVVSQYFIHAQWKSPPRRSGRAQLTHPAPSRYLAIALPSRAIAIRSIRR